MSTITVYDGPNCQKCRITKRHLDKLDAPYTTTPAHQADGTIHPTIRGLGHTSLPIVTVTDEAGTITAHWSDLSVDNIQAAAYLVTA